MANDISPQPDEAAEPPDLGFGRVVAAQTRGRLINKDGSPNARKYGLGGQKWQKLYLRMLNAPWSTVLGWMGGALLLINGIFALGYLSLGTGALVGTDELALTDPFLRAFFFSVAVFSTTGTGQMHAVGLTANWLVALESLGGVVGLMFMGAMLVARLTRPRVRIRFSESAVLAPYQGGRAFMFRIINVRPSEVIDVQCRVNLAWFEEVDGKRTRTFHQLALERNQIEFFSLQWVIVHPITAESPMHGLTPEQLRASEAEFFVLVSGTEESFSTRVHARSSYRFDEVRWDAKFADMFVASPDGIITVDVDRLDRMDRLPEGATRVPAASEG